MKKFFLVGALALFGVVNAQTGLKVGAHIGLPTGDLAEFSSFNAGVDVSYLYTVSEEFRVGATTGYSLNIGKKIGGEKIENFGIVPFAASAEYTVASKFFVGADLGYGILTNVDTDKKGGFYYQPKVGYQLDKIDLTFSYKGLSRDGVSLNTINLGAAYRF